MRRANDSHSNNTSAARSTRRRVRKAPIDSREGVIVLCSCTASFDDGAVEEKKNRTDRRRMKRMSWGERVETGTKMRRGWRRFTAGHLSELAHMCARHYDPTRTGGFVRPSHDRTALPALTTCACTGWRCKRAAFEHRTMVCAEC